MTIFWRLFLPIFILLLASCSDDDKVVDVEEPSTEIVTIDVKPGMNLVGKITDGTSPIEGVVVTDGFTVTTTDKDGIYQLAANTDSARFVSISVPAEYEIPLDNMGIPQMYKRIEMLGYDKLPAIQRDFVLTKGVKKTNFTLVALADVQIGTAADFSLLQKSETGKIKEYVSSLNQPVYGISLGDLVWDNIPFFANYRNEISKINIPIFQLVGNHDHDQYVSNNDYNATLQYEKFFGPTYYSYNIGDCHFVVLDDVYFQNITDKSDYSGFVTSNQMRWLKEDLKHVSKDKLIIIGTHIPTKRRVSNTQVTNNTELYSLLDGYQVRILSGHSHYNYTTTISSTIEENTLGAVMGEFWTGQFCSDGSPMGYGIYEINGNQIKNSYYKGTHQDKEYQMKVYGPGQSVSVEYRQSVLINVFNWHSTWTVALAEDGKTPTVLKENIKEYDVDAYAFLGLVGDATKPAVRPALSGAIKTDHMFKYTPTSTSWKKITVTATDPYGNVYTETVNNVVGYPYFRDDFSWAVSGPDYISPTVVKGTEVRFSAAGGDQKTALINSGWTAGDPNLYVYIHQGYLKFANSKDFGVLISPPTALTDIATTDDVRLTFDASCYKTTSDLDAGVKVTVKIVAGTGTINNDTDTSIEIPLLTAGSDFTKCSLIIKGASATTQFSIESSAGALQRMFLDNVYIETTKPKP